MKPFLVFLMFANSALFLFGAVQHAGIRIGTMHEPRIVPATIVEGLCALALAWGAAAILSGHGRAWRTALIANVVAFGGVVLGIAALAAGAGPRTATNDLYHRIMLVLIGASVVVLLTPPGRAAARRG